MEITINCPELTKLTAAIEKITPVLLSVVNAAVYLNSEEIVETPQVQAQYQPPIQMPVAPTQPVNQMYMQTASLPTMQPPININPPQQTAPPSVVPPVQQIMPTTHVSQEFTIEQIQFAMSGLVDAGKMNVVTDIMKSFNVAAITQIAKEQYPAVVMRLREAGAQI